MYLGDHYRRLRGKACGHETVTCGLCSQWPHSHVASKRLARAPWIQRTLLNTPYRSVLVLSFYLYTLILIINIGLRTSTRHLSHSYRFENLCMHDV